VEGYGSWVLLSTAPPNNHKYIARLEKILSRNVFRRETSGAPDKTVKFALEERPKGSQFAADA